MFTLRMPIAVIAATAAVAVVAAGCSGNQSGSSATPATSSSTSSSLPTATRADFNDADVAFLQGMYPHHAQAVEMAKLAPGRSQNQQVTTLAANIEKAQGPEMQQIAALLQSFGKPAPTDTMQMDGMPGMMTPDQMTALTALSGTEFDRTWLQMMIEHHTGAIAMSNTELTDGTNADATKLAQAIIANQQAEISQMRGMLGQN